MAVQTRYKKLAKKVHQSKS